MSRTRLRLENLERRDTPAMLPVFSGGTLSITFDNEPIAIPGPHTAQSVQISATPEGVVTLNDVPLMGGKMQPVQANQVTQIIVEGSEQANWIDLQYVNRNINPVWQSVLNGRISILGHGGDDFLRGSGFDDRIRGGNGFDQVVGLGGNDWLAGDAGDDWIYGGDGNDVIQGGAGYDYLERIYVGDRVVNYQPNVDLAEFFGTTPFDAAANGKLIERLRAAGWSVKDQR